MGWRPASGELTGVITIGVAAITGPVTSQSSSVPTTPPMPQPATSRAIGRSYGTTPGHPRMWRTWPQTGAQAGSGAHSRMGADGSGAHSRMGAQTVSSVGCPPKPLARCEIRHPRMGQFRRRGRDADVGFRRAGSSPARGRASTARGCQGVPDRAGPRGAGPRRCCSYGAHFVDRGDAKRVERIAHPQTTSGNYARRGGGRGSSTRTRTGNGSPGWSAVPASS